MAIISKPRCKVCNSDQRAEIEEYCRTHKPNNSWQKLAAMVYRDLGLKIGQTSLWNHMRLHCDIKDEVLEEYAKARMKDTWEDNHVCQNGSPELQAIYEAQSVEAAKFHIAHHVEEIRKLDEIIKRDFALYMKTADRLSEQLRHGRTPERESIQLLKTLNSNLNTSMKTRMELLGEDAASRVADSLETWLDLVNKLE